MNKKSKLGYSKKSPYKNEPFIDIASNSITMKGTEFPVLAIPDNDKPILMMPGKNYKFPNSKKVREVKLQHGGNFGLAGENTMPMSPFINLKPFINKYKLKHGGVIDYMATLPLEQQVQFAEEFDSFDPETQKEVEEYLKGGYYQSGGNVSQSGGIYDYQMGGQPNAELEDQETLITPDGKLSKITGKTHDQGGVEVNLPDGTRIYSEHLKVPKNIVKQVLGKESKKKLSYADVSKKFPTKPYIDILENPESDQYQINTAEIKLTNNLGKLDTLFFAQEKEKQGEGNENKYKCGGMKKHQFGGSGAGVNFDWVTGRLLPPGQSILQYQATEENIPGMLPSIPTGGDQSKAKQIAAGFQRPQDWTTQFPKIHSEPAATVSTGVVLNLRNDVPIFPTEDQTVQPSPVAPKVGDKQPKQSTKRRGISTAPAPIVIEDTELQVPLPLERLPQRIYSNLTSTSRGLPVPSTEQVADTILTQDDKDFQGKKKRGFKFGISPELAGTVADIGLALSDKLRVSEPTYYDRRKYPLFTRFIDFDDKEVQRMYDKNIQQIQNSNVPENVKQAKISELMGQYQDYQAKIDYGNLQRYEGKRERDTEKLQQYLDTNIDQKVADIESYRQRKARVDELRDAFYAQRKSRVVNSLKAYAEYADQISKANEFTPNYRINPITGRIDYRPQQQTNLRENILQQYQKKNQNKIDLGSGATAQVFGNVLIITDKDGKVSTQKLDQSE